MKSIIISILISALLAQGGGSVTANNYTVTTGQAQPTGKTVTIQTEDGNLWAVKGKYKGNYIVVFDNKGTDKVKNDVIVKMLKLK